MSGGRAAGPRPSAATAAPTPEGLRRKARGDRKAPASGSVAAKMMGRWRSGATLALRPLHDDPQLGADNGRNNAFL